jgi:ABC-type transporter Mla MlaB component
MLRISRAAPEGDSSSQLLRLEGQVAGEWVEELRHVSEETLGSNDPSGRALVLDLSGISFVDSEGVALCRELAGRGVRFTNCSPFIAEQLKEVADGDN